MARAYAIIEARETHVKMLVPRLRALDCAEIFAGGQTALQSLTRCYQRSTLRRSAFVEGEIAAMWGLGGGCLGPVGLPWLLTSPAIERAPIAFVKEARREVAAMLEIHPRLANYVLASYDGAVRLLSILGFTLGPPEPHGPEGALFRKFTMERP